MACESDRPSWHSKPELNAALYDYYVRHGRQADCSEAKQDLQERLDCLHSELGRQGLRVKEVQYVGGTYEQLALANGGDFDIMVVFEEKGLQTAAIPKIHIAGGEKNYCYLTVGNGRRLPQPLQRSLIGDVVSGEKFASCFQGLLDKALTSGVLGEGVTCHKNGPAFRWQVSKNGKPWYPVDIVPTMKVDGEYYVAKQHPQERAAWHHSYSLEMKNLLRTMDKGDNGCRHEVVRTVKAIFKHEPPLHMISSHHLKMAVLWERKENPDKTWAPKDRVQRVLDLTKRTGDYLKAGHFPHYFVPDVNMACRIVGANSSNMQNRLGHLYNSERHFSNVIRR